MNHFRTLSSIATVVALGTLSGCGAVVLSGKEDYTAIVQRLHAEIDTASTTALQAAASGDEKLLTASSDQIYRACDRIDRYVDGAEAAVRSYYGQQNSLATLAAIENATYQRNCKVDGLDRLEEETHSLRNSAQFLHDACNCGNDVNDPGAALFEFRQCDLQEAVWEEYWDRHETEAGFLAEAAIFGLSTGFLIPILVADALNTATGRSLDRAEACSSAYSTYHARFETVAHVREFCATPPAAVPAAAPMTAAALDVSIKRALDNAHFGLGEPQDGSALYASAVAAQLQCTDLIAGLEQLTAPDTLQADIDTKADQEPGVLDREYSPPEDPGYVPPRE